MSPNQEQTLASLIRSGWTPRQAIAQMLKLREIQNEKQAHRTLEKWCRQGIYEYGVTLDLGWFK